MTNVDDKAQDDKKQRVLEAAYQILATEGLQALSFSRIAERADLSRQLVRYYFDTLDAVMISVCDYLAGLYRAGLVGGLVELDETRRLDFFLDFYFGLLGDPAKPRDDQAYDAAFAFAAGCDKVRQSLKAQYGLLGQIVSHEIQLKYPALKTNEALELSYLFVCLMYGHWKMVASLGYSEDHKYITRNAIDRLIQSYVRRDVTPAHTVIAWNSDS